MSVSPLVATIGSRGARSHTQVTARGVLRSEWIKLRSVRSSRITLLAAAATMILGGAILGYATSASDWASLEEELRAPSATMAGYVLSQLVIGVLGALFVASEYSSGMIRTTFAAVPNRIAVIAAKSTVLGAVTLIVMTVAGLLAFLSAQIFLSADGHGTSLADSDALNAVLGIGAYMAFVAVLGAALAWIFRSAAAAIGVLVGLLLVLPSIVQLLPGSVGDSVSPYAPTNAGEALWANSSPQVELLSPLRGAIVLLAWLAVSLTTAVMVARRRDA